MKTEEELRQDIQFYKEQIAQAREDIGEGRKARRRVRNKPLIGKYFAIEHYFYLPLSVLEDGYMGAIRFCSKDFIVIEEGYPFDIYDNVKVNK